MIVKIVENYKLHIQHEFIHSCLFSVYKVNQIMIIIYIDDYNILDARQVICVLRPKYHRHYFLKLSSNIFVNSSCHSLVPSLFLLCTGQGQTHEDADSGPVCPDISDQDRKHLLHTAKMLLFLMVMLVLWLEVEKVLCHLF